MNNRHLSGLAAVNKMVVLIAVAAGTGALFLPQAALADAIRISGTHSKDEIRSTCAAGGWTYWESPESGGYGCINYEKGTNVSCGRAGDCMGYTPDMQGGPVVRFDLRNLGNLLDAPEVTPAGQPIPPQFLPPTGAVFSQP